MTIGLCMITIGQGTASQRGLSDEIGKADAPT